jgi:hypothetical protein
MTDFIITPTAEEVMKNKKEIAKALKYQEQIIRKCIVNMLMHLIMLKSTKLMFDFYKNPFYRYKNNFIFFVIFL